MTIKPWQRFIVVDDPDGVLVVDRMDPYIDQALVADCADSEWAHRIAMLLNAAQDVTHQELGD